ncbi:hypothetical protein [Cupriavidus basilensis]|uniref:Uncharacterized protein n=1 Tax=Cupriavidus basilensis TaxID=68895 RepID=A0A643G3N7_9BURK|nr:hypothetical protein [Cupriavidus basilensis]QOT74844.1 hypothetical protein F7R26_011255 [Cupriavidus basilensis]
MLILEAIGTATKAVFATPERIFFAAVLVVLALAGGSVWVYRGERDSARAELVKARADLAKAKSDNQALAASVSTQNAAVAGLEAQAKIRQYQAAKADAEAQATQSKYTLLAGKIQAQAPGANQCASLHGLRQTFVKERP